MKRKQSSGPLVWIIALLIVAAAAGYIYYYVNQSSAVAIFFLKDQKVVEVKRSLPEGADPFKFAADELILGTTSDEKALGLLSEIPKGTRIIKVEKQGDQAIVTFNEKLEQYGGGSARVQGMVAQIVYTFTAQPEIRRVKIKVEGKDGAVLGGEGFVIDQALSREDLKN